MVYELTINTNSKTEMVDITNKIQGLILDSGMEGGICTLFVPHTTAAVTINENADLTVQKDILKELNKVIPFEDDYQHLEGNSAAHIKSTLVGCSQQLIIEKGELVLGTWQGIYFCEFDGPRSRKLKVKLA
ncbi:secondary thiamine-phosphate synthase enzyme YjbQ [Sporohalobacter salinus]|uniref:secondary thiamine-phosphate synthase enzyme YjbQ n=1 Tax=Sporohalobacter salinus TaxID=1494606 RepID=UPI00195F818B|nr:secondary thiamine-phosphate synthase enzyme YjbQ [Sporohalobacter salinus]MBM7622582.1 secondary thiamine-phosphate synthase enzyme [Sporohalobacter salinus]